MSKPILIRSGKIVTMNLRREVLTGDILIQGSRIQKIGTNIAPPKDAEVVEARDHFVIPGLIQVHTHLCQTLFRGYADDLKLLDWLKQRIWPMESSHDFDSLTASAEIGLLEMQKAGTTSILDMATVHHTAAVFAAAKKSGIRYWGGKCLMDLKNSSGPLYEKRDRALAETELLIKDWHKSTELIKYAICPRFAVSCSREIMLAARKLQEKYGVLLHTHASESKEEIALIKSRTGYNNVDYFDSLGLLNPLTVIVHGVHLTRAELKKMVHAGTGLVHCPSSNLKLASGIAPIENYLHAGLKIGLGSDGAPCNNTMDPFVEMRLAALLQKPKFGPEALPAQTAFELATLGGAKVLGEEKNIGSLEPGKFADIVLVDRRSPAIYTVENPYSALVYSASSRDVRHVMVHGQWVVRNHRHLNLDESVVLASARKNLESLFSRLKVPTKVQASLKKLD